MSEAARRNTEVTSSGSASVCFWSRLPRDRETSVTDVRYMGVDARRRNKLYLLNAFGTAVS